MLHARPQRLICLIGSLLLVPSATPWLYGQDAFIPRRQSNPPGPPLSPSEALAKMTVPPGFHVELVASEPDLVNPVAMAFDDAGRLYVTESFEYPRRSAGPGRDRIKILEDTNQDGRFDSVKVFAEGLNIPSGIAVGHGGVWVANAPDLLFLQDTDGDDRADKETVVVTGFGRDDTHELPNSLTWGPDGFLYGLNGVFNRSVVKQDGKTFDFTCAMFRIDPVTHRFELFCEGTSNPWGIAFDHEGEAFISACVIDHLWHLTETGYYHRQGGPYPPHTWKIDSIVSHKHQMAAYCGIEFFDSPAYPREYRNKLYMGNIHGGCINVDSVQRHGSTYRGKGHPDFLTAHDVWFMPVAQKVGPDGCLYILDWYDRYHCYQDANADPQGVDRGHGRLYRVVYEQRPAITHKNLAELTDDALVGLLSDENIHYRQRAAVILNERFRSEPRESHRNTVLDMQARITSGDRPTSMHLLTTALVSPQTTLQELATMYRQFREDPVASSWCIRVIGERLSRVSIDSKRPETMPTEDREVVATVLRIAASADDPRIRLQTAIAAGKLDRSVEIEPNATQLMLDVLRGSRDDGLLARIVWRNLEPRVVENRDEIVAAISTASADDRLLVELAPRVATRLLAEVKPDLSQPGDRQTLLSVLAIADSLAAATQQPAGEVLRAVLAKLRTGEIRPEAAKPILQAWHGSGDGPMHSQLRSFAGDPDATRRIGAMLLDRDLSSEIRREVLETAALTHPQSLLAALNQWVLDLEEQRQVPDMWRDALLTTVVSRGDEQTQRRLLDQWSRMPVGVRAMLAGRMIQREQTSRLLLGEIISGALAKDMLGPNQIRQLAASTSAEIQQAVRTIWGSVRTEDSAGRQAVVKAMTDHLLTSARGDAHRGWAVYDRICGQCHQMHGRGYEVGPEITRNGRGNFEQLIVSVFDPSLVIGEAYESVNVVTLDGRVLSGLVVEQNDQRVVLKVQGGKTETVPMDDVETLQKSKLSLMPEGLEEQMTRQEMADLFALLSLQNPPSSDTNEWISGTPESLHRAPPAKHSPASIPAP